MTSTKRDVDYIGKLLDDAVSEDVHLRVLFSKDKTSENPLIAEI